MSFEDQQLSYAALERLVSTLNQAKRGDFSVRMAAKGGSIMEAEVADALNDLLTLQGAVTAECARLSEAIAQGDLHERASVQGAEQGFEAQLRSVNGVVALFARHASELRRVSKAMHAGDFSRAISVGAESTHRGGELLKVAEEVNGLLVHLERISSEVSRVAAEVGLDGNLGSQVHLADVSGSWAMVVGGLNAMSASLAEQVHDLSATAQSLGKGQLAARASVASRGALHEVKTGLNGAAEGMAALCAELRRVSHEVVGDGKLSAEMRHPNPMGEWQSAQEATNRILVEFSRGVRWATSAVSELASGHTELPPYESLGDMGKLVTAMQNLAAMEGVTQEVIDGLVVGRFPQPDDQESARGMSLFKLGLRLKREWFRAARTGIVESAMHSKREDYARAALAWLANTVNAEVGTFYFSEGAGRLSLVACHGCTRETVSDVEVRVGEGLLGQVAASGDAMVLSDLDPKRVRIRTGLVEVTPTAVVLAPVVVADEVVGVVELAFTEGDPELAKELLSFLAADLGEATLRAFRVDSNAVGNAGDEARALGEELAIATARIERLTRELSIRDKVVRELQQEAAALRDELDSVEQGHAPSSTTSAAG